MSVTSCAVLIDGDTQTLKEKYHYIFSGDFRLSSVFHVISLTRAFGFCVTWEQKRLLFPFMTCMYGPSHKHASLFYDCQPAIYSTIKTFHFQITGWDFNSLPVSIFIQKSSDASELAKKQRKRLVFLIFLLWRREWFTKIQMCFFPPMKIQNL